MTITIGAVIAAVGSFLLIKFGFGCSHKDYSFPITKRPGTRLTSVQQVTGTYVACLECGKEFAYDWQNMRVLSEKESKRHARDSVAPASS